MKPYDDSDVDEGFRLLLGDIVVTSLSASAWENESCHDDSYTQDDDTNYDEGNEHSVKGLPMKILNNTLSKTVGSTNKDCVLHPYGTEAGHCNDDHLFSLAFTCNNLTRLGGLQRPPVQIVDLGPTKGNGLIATQKIAKGNVIFTERATVASLTDDTILACENCFRSMEPITSCAGIMQQQSHRPPIGDDESRHKEFGECFPSTHLWPVLPLVFDDDDDDESSKNDLTSNPVVTQSTRRDKYGRIQCNTCHKLFCSENCRTIFNRELGSCCILTKIFTDLPRLLRLDHSNNNQQDIEGVYSDDDDTSNSISSVQCAVLLAIRMFTYSLQEHRRFRKGKSLLSDLCGSETELTELEIGIGQRHTTVENMTITEYTLEPVYNYLIDAFSMSDQEQSELSYTAFTLLAVQAARNGFGIRTQSPFQSYYASLLRSTVRGSKHHQQMTRQVLSALGVSELDRRIDETINRRVSPQLSALFSLTSRINHACSSSCNAEVRSQEFVDCHADIVARRDILAGEEILISYIEGSHRKSRHRRQRELQAKYLFLCACTSCQNS
jgi:SET domain